MATASTGPESAAAKRVLKNGICQEIATAQTQQQRGMPQPPHPVTGFVKPGLLPLLRNKRRISPQPGAVAAPELCAHAANA